VAGMVRSVRSAGRRLRFIDLWAGEQKIQLIVRTERLTGGSRQEELADQLRRGDRIGR